MCYTEYALLALLFCSFWSSGLSVLISSDIVAPCTRLLLRRRIFIHVRIVASAGFEFPFSSTFVSFCRDRGFCAGIFLMLVQTSMLSRVWVSQLLKFLLLLRPLRCRLISSLGPYLYHFFLYRPFRCSHHTLLRYTTANVYWYQWANDCIFCCSTFLNVPGYTIMIPSLPASLVYSF